MPVMTVEPRTSAKEEPEVYAQLFVDDLEQDSMLRRDWSQAMSQAQRLPQAQREASLNAFLSERGYSTTVASVKQVLAKPIDPSELPNGDAVLFATRLITEGALRKQWDAAVQQLASGETPELAPVQRILDQNNVQATPLQVARAVATVSSSGISAWVDSYGDTTIGSGSDRYPGPTLIVTGSYVALDTHRVVGESFDAATATLSWTADLNATAASLVFSRRTEPTDQDPYVGNTFAGMLTLPEQGYSLKGIVSFSGRAGPPRQQPPSTTNRDIENLKNAAVVLTVVVSGTTMLTLGYRFRKFLAHRWTEARTRYRRWRGQEESDLDEALGRDLDLDLVDITLGQRKYAQMARLMEQLSELEPAAKVGPEGRELLDRLDEVREGLTEEQKDVWERARRDQAEDLEEVEL